MFDLFIGVDWSGARGEFHKGIQVAEAQADDAAPQIITPPHPRGWSRAAVLDHLRQRAATRSVLAGIDFAFAHPYGDAGYYPGSGTHLPDAPALWQMVEDVNAGQDHLYGGGIWQHPQYGSYYNAPVAGGRGTDFTSRRRLTEVVSAKVNGRHPSPTFNCVGPAGVGTGSLAGMRMLHRLAGEAAIWPLLPRDGAALTVTEIFPALYFAMAGVTDRQKKADPLTAVNTALASWGSRGVTTIAERLPDHDDVDALISAAALRRLASRGMPELPADATEITRCEGWIFGVGWAKDEP